MSTEATPEIAFKSKTAADIDMKYPPVKKSAFG
jgi:hypothetical protein